MGTSSKKRLSRGWQQYLYTDGELFQFMDSATYEEYHINRQAIGDKGGFLKDGMEVALTIYGSKSWAGSAGHR